MYSLKNILIKSGYISKEQMTLDNIFCLQVNRDMAMQLNNIQNSLNYYTFTIIKKGICEIIYDGKKMQLESGNLYMCMPGQSVIIEEISEDYKGIWLLVSDIIIYEKMFSQNMIRSDYYGKLRYEKPVLKLPPEIYERILSLLKEIDEYLNSNKFLKEEASTSLLSLFLIDLINYQKLKSSNINVSKRKEKIVRDFLSLLSENYKKHHDIGFYADSLCITKIYLSRIIKELTGLTVIQHIDHMLMMEATWLLKSTDYNIKEIAYDLNFADQGSFSKYFKRLKGISPKNYRK